MPWLHHVLRGDHAQVAVAGFGRVHKEGGGARGGEGGRNFSPNVATFAHAADDHAAAALEQGVDGTHKMVIQPLCHIEYGLGFGA
jgi:hypothetical protein